MRLARRAPASADHRLLAYSWPSAYPLWPVAAAETAATGAQQYPHDTSGAPQLGGYRLVTMADTGDHPSPRYRRPYAVAGSLELLHGPVSGVVQLPAHLDWSGHAGYDLDAPGRIIDLYRAVLVEAASPQDLYAYLNAAVLRRLWAVLWLPTQLRRSWEQKFPVLAEISRITATA
ncbi:hypothetical protein [Pseudofrankia sp. BMG5.37]|uniref:hypothetical protein n=1 Tax=Pseudofrankia sp. BMG5.37 TaxID=3050035 RepID=UPI0028962B0B|nr:hypothetical protein [Pseudofrankia sp. BMG5.37]MDT3443889.1 hypothetical protein [Pseudofrankia sp. BMG5.37]